MNRVALLVATAMTTTVLAAPVFAAENLCDVNLTKLQNNEATRLVTMGEPSKSQITELTKSATDAKAKGDEKKCIADSQQALLMYERPGTGKGANN